MKLRWSFEAMAREEQVHQSEMAREEKKHQEEMEGVGTLN